MMIFMSKRLKTYPVIRRSLGSTKHIHDASTLGNKSGVRYYDENGNEKDLITILAENGVNYVRVRIWNNPYDDKGLILWGLKW
mgnify:CR=1 FL=1